MSSPQVPLEVRYQERLAVVLAAVASFVDAYGYIRYGAYLSYMSGNTTMAGVHTARGDWAPVTPLLTGIVAFLAGVFAGSLVVDRSGVQARRTIFALTAVTLVLAFGLNAVHFLQTILSIGLICFAMGALNASLSQVGAQGINLTFITGTLNRLGKHLAGTVTATPLANAKGAWDTHLRRALQLGSIWLGFFLGAVLSGVMTSSVGVWALIVPVGVLLALAVLDREDRHVPSTPH